VTPGPIQTALRHRGLRDSGVLLVVAGLVTVALYWPILLGRVPLPAELVTNFPLWDSWRPGPPAPLHHAELGDLII
jgi:hypothetical protein